MWPVRRWRCARVRSSPCPPRRCVALGAVGSVPGGVGVVVGGAIPYTPEALAKKKENQENWLTRDPEIKCYLPGVPRATYMPFPFQIFQSDKAFFIAYEYAGAVRNIYLKDPGPPQVDSWMGQSVGRWEGDTFRRRHQRIPRSELVRSRGQPPQRSADGDRALHDDRARSHSVRSDDRRTRRSSRARGKSACRCTGT